MNILPLPQRAALLVILSLACCPQSAFAQALTFTAAATGNFGTDVGVRFEGVAANGTAVGTSIAANGDQTAVRWTAAGGFTSLGLNTGGETSTASAISPDGTYVIGQRIVPAGEDYTYLSVRWSNADGALTMTNTIGGSFFQSYQVNNSGTVAVRAADSADLLQAGTWTNGGGVNAFTTLGGAAFGINSAGAVVGTARSGSNQVAFLWTSGGGVQSLGTLGGANSFAQRVNDAGLVAGWSDASGGGGLRHVFTWTSGGGMVDLGDYLYAEVTGLNSAGDLVFNAEDPITGNTRPFFYSNATGTIYDLTNTLSSSGVITDLDQSLFVAGVSDDGLLVGYASGSETGFSVAVSAVPEPSTYAALAGLAALGLVVWRRRAARQPSRIFHT